MKLKQFIEKISIKNKDLEYTDILGINKYKQFIPTIANTHGTDLRKYQILEKDYFACNLMHIGRDYVIPIAHYSKEEPAIISPAYKVFRISKENLILPDTYTCILKMIGLIDYVGLKQMIVSEEVYLGMISKTLISLFQK